MEDYRDMHEAPYCTDEFKEYLESGGQSGEALICDLRGYLRGDYDCSKDEATEILKDACAAHRGPGGNQFQFLNSLAFLANLGKDPEVKIYRACPKDIKEINPGDWISFSRDYCLIHGHSRFDGTSDIGSNWHILEKSVKLSEVYWDQESPYEFGYDNANVKELKEKYFSLKEQDMER